MPQTGYCADITCSQVLTQLYECHCCQCFICLNHLLEHVEISRRNQERIDLIRQDLSLVSSKLRTLVEKKLEEIEHEKRLIAQASQLLETDRHSMDDIQRVLEAMNQAIASNPAGQELRNARSTVHFLSFSRRDRGERRVCLVACENRC